MTVIAYGSAVHLALEAAERLDADIEVIGPPDPLPARPRGDPHRGAEDRKG